METKWNEQLYEEKRFPSSSYLQTMPASQVITPVQVDMR
jgi:hypothetical protein